MPIDSQRRKDVYKLVPEGSLVSRTWLKNNALSNHAIDNLVKSKASALGEYLEYSLSDHS